MFKLYFLHFLSDLDVLGLVGNPEVIGKLFRNSPHITGLLYAGYFGLENSPHITGLLYAGYFGLENNPHITGLLYAGNFRIVNKKDVEYILF